MRWAVKDGTCAWRTRGARGQAHGVAERQAQGGSCAKPRTSHDPGQHERKQLHGDVLSKESHSRSQGACGAGAPSGAPSHRACVGRVCLAVRVRPPLALGVCFFSLQKIVFLKKKKVENEIGILLPPPCFVQSLEQILFAIQTQGDKSLQRASLGN